MALEWQSHPQLRDPILVCSFKGWNDARRRRRSSAVPFLSTLRSRVRSRRRPGGLLRLPGEPPDDPPGRGADRAGSTGRRTTFFAARVPAAERDLVLLQRHRADPALAHFLGARCRRRRDAGRRDDGHPGRADRRRRAHPAGADHRPRLGRGAGRATRPRALQLRGPDRHRRRPARRLRERRHDLGSASGPRSPTTSPPSRTRRRRSPCCAGSRA